MKIIMGKFCHLQKCSFYSNCLIHDSIVGAQSKCPICPSAQNFATNDETWFECEISNGESRPLMESAMEICPCTDQYVGLFHKENTEYESIRSEACGYDASYSICDEVDEDNRLVGQADLPEQFIGSPRKRKAEPLTLGPNTRMADGEGCISSFAPIEKRAKPTISFGMDFKIVIKTKGEL